MPSSCTSLYGNLITRSKNVILGKTKNAFALRNKTWYTVLYSCTKFSDIPLSACRRNRVGSVPPVSADCYNFWHIETTNLHAIYKKSTVGEPSPMTPFKYLNYTRPQFDDVGRQLFCSVLVLQQLA